MFPPPGFAQKHHVSIAIHRRLGREAWNRSEMIRVRLDNANVIHYDVTLLLLDTPCSSGTYSQPSLNFVYVIDADKVFW